MVKRYAIVRGARDANEVAAYMPANYEVIYEMWDDPAGGRPAIVVVIAGRDNAGWGLDSYVIPRLASGFMSASEIDLSHPIFKGIPA